jgi:hypothetical protein
MTMAPYAGSVAIVWMVRMVADVHSYAWSMMPSSRTPPPSPVRLTTGEGMPVRWIVVGIAGGLCVLLLGCALALAIRTRTGRRPVG